MDPFIFLAQGNLLPIHRSFSLNPVKQLKQEKKCKFQQQTESVELLTKIAVAFIVTICAIRSEKTVSQF
jgi:hypothetical protein